MEELVAQFCTPPAIPITESDQKNLNASEKIEIEFEGRILDAYCWGKGRTIILTHGWGSRASHMAFLARYLSEAGFRVIAFDSPAHSSLRTEGIKDNSNMFEFCRALYTVVKKFGPVYAIIGHSLGAAATAFTVSGFGRLSHYKIEVEKIVLISAFFDGNSIIRNFCVNHEKGISIFDELKKGLETEFDFSADYYSVAEALKNVDKEILLIHDENDEVFPFSEAKLIKEANPGISIFSTKGYGHYKILVNRTIPGRIKEFLAD
jgi:pimeloyl-ACP methyl ester carboxylesterase